MPSTELRQTVLCNARRIVVKVGTGLLTSPDPDRPGLDLNYIRRIARQIAGLREQGYEVTLVASGAIGAGCLELGLKQRPRDVADLQAVAAVGQRKLMAHMHQAFARQKIHVAQMLVTRGDFDDRVRFLNIRNCVTRIHEHGCIPIINENDTVAVDELRFGDNDMLAALTANAIRADALLLLTVVDGLLDEQGNRVDLIDNVTDMLSLARRDTSQWGTGGMLSKLEATRVVTEAGEIAVIANGQEKNVLARLLAGEALGSVFVPATRKLDSRQRWIALTARPAGTITIDEGAVRAVTGRGKSLLATGIADITGRFERGDVALIRDPRGREVARGLSNYSADELRLIRGKRSTQFANILGRSAYDEVIHRNNLVVLTPSDGR
ncbi:glutamate 5-kinase [Phycisphaerales bacterium AB-hyl4]|uniref:Glutamate 5-kinase n=1 Tax=Natronomicrosphaera hydrolytica TaxID=3242702 RepID=A0ABV4U1M4_9BACT